MERGLRWRGRSLPSEKSWSAGSMVVGGSKGNSKSGSGSDPGRGESQGGRWLTQAREAIVNATNVLIHFGCCGDAYITPLSSYMETRATCLPLSLSILCFIGLRLFIGSAFKYKPNIH